jgi:ligand-binding sensor domain-containing protein
VWLRVRQTAAWLLVCLACASVLGDGNADYHCQIWTRENGLPRNTIRALLQTRDGYLWAATPLGTVRFDGLRFFLISHAGFPVMTSDNCRALAEDGEGAVWIGTDAGLLRWRSGTLTRFTTNDGLRDDDVFSLCASPDGGLWVGTSQGVAHLAVGKLTPYTADDGLRTGPIEALLADRRGTLWVGTHQGLQRLRPGAPRFEDFRPAEVVNPDYWYCRSIGADGEGAIWFGNADRLFRVASESETVTIYRGVLVEKRATAIVPDPAGGIWFADGSYGLVHFDRGNVRRYPVRTKPGLDDAYCLIQDREGSLWIGTETGGLHCWRRRALNVLSTQDGLAHDNVWSVCQSPDGGVWVGADEGLSRFRENRFVADALPGSLPHPAVRALAHDTAGALWIGTGNGLACLHDGQLTTRRFAGFDPRSDSGGLSRNKIRALLAAQDGALWVAVPAGLYRLRDGQESFFTTTNGLPHADVRALAQTRDGSIWVGTAGGGVGRITGLDPESAALGLTVFQTADGLCSDYVWAFHEDAEGALWIGTERGLNRLTSHSAADATPRSESAPRVPRRLPPTGPASASGSRPGLESFTTRHGLPRDLVNFILEDDQGHLWISHDEGIYRVRKQDLAAVAAGRLPAAPCVSYDENDGMLSRETNGQRSQPAGCRTRDGRLWFASTKGGH